jgi:hypothetical protein
MSKVSIFVDLYLKQLGPAGSPGERPQLTQVSGRLEEVEETVAVLRQLPAVTKDADAEQATAQLARRIGRLRKALDEFGDGDA